MRRTPRRFGFTLLELLVVVGLIVTLAAILVPAVSRVTAMTRQTQCAANMRSIYDAIIAYAADNGGYYPITPSIGESGNPSLAYWMNTSAGPAVIDYTHGTLWPYLDPHNVGFRSTATTEGSLRYRVFNCPADQTDFRLSRAGTLALEPRNYTYSFNAEMRERLVGGQWFQGIRVSQVAKAQFKIITVEEQWPNDGLAFLGYIDQQNGNFYTLNPSVNRDSDDVMSARHNGRANQGFADGHVECLDPRDLGFNIYSIEFGTTSGPTNNSNLVAARALDLFYSQ